MNIFLIRNAAVIIGKLIAICASPMGDMLASIYLLAYIIQGALLIAGEYYRFDKIGIFVMIAAVLIDIGAALYAGFGYADWLTVASVATSLAAWTIPDTFRVYQIGPDWSRKESKTNTRRKK